MARFGFEPDYFGSAVSVYDDEDDGRTVAQMPDIETAEEFAAEMETNARAYDVACRKGLDMEFISDVETRVKGREAEADNVVLVGLALLGVIVWAVFFYGVV